MLLADTAFQQQSLSMADANRATFEYDVGNNALTGTLPVAMSTNFPNLEFLTLNNNNFTGMLLLIGYMR